MHQLGKKKKKSITVKTIHLKCLFAVKLEVTFILPELISVCLSYGKIEVL